MTEHTPSDLLTLDEVADLIGVARASVRVYHQRAATNRKAGTARATDMPAPDAQFGRVPTWTREHVEAWDAVRVKRPAKAVADPPPLAAHGAEWVSP